MNKYSPRVENIVKWSDRVMTYAFYAGIYFLPISIVLIEYSFGFALISFFVKRTTLCLAGLKELACQQHLTSFSKKIRFIFKAFKPVDSCLTLPIGIFLLVNFLTIFISYSPWLSIKGFVFKLLEGTFFYFTFIECMNSKKKIKVFVAVFMVSATLVSLSGWWQLLTGKDFIFGHPLEGGRMNASLRQANDLGAYMEVVALLWLGIVFFNNLLPKFIRVKNEGTASRGPGWGICVLSVLLVLLFISCLGLSFSRGAWIAFFVGIALIIIRDIRLLPIPIVVISLFCYVFAPQILEKRNVTMTKDVVLSEEQFEKRFGNDAELIKNAIGSGRKNYWREAIAIIRDSPALGSGLNTYSVVARHYKISWGGYPHNSYLHMAAEIGIIGLAAFLWIIFKLTFSIISHLRSIQDRFLSAVHLGASMAIVAFLAHSFVETHFYSVQLANYMWIIFGLIIATQNPALSSSHDVQS